MNAETRLPQQITELFNAAAVARSLARLKSTSGIGGAYDCIVPAQGKELVKTDLQINLPEGCYGRIAPRSGLSWKNHLDVGESLLRL
ncbi:hypothetical protein LSTR_LSTR013429 [Laodelphax striatellus]|uniref:dUTP diphosphatase n=1 Tax=Laodelphax striatellus TaxID=195883 RepID=A0A482WUT0_LAOST|nr:hypothetical protein LSTR_LSTR013429 [Laodelphax striatellus]